MSGLLPQVFIASILITALAIMGRSAIDTNARLYTSQVLQATSALEAARESVEIESVTPGSPVEDLTIALLNDGKRDIGRWSSIDVIAIYSTASGQVTERLTHTDSAVTPGTWAPLTGDVYQPGILNVDESLELRAYLSNGALSSSNACIILTLESGATFSSTFTFP